MATTFSTPICLLDCQAKRVRNCRRRPLLRRHLCPTAAPGGGTARFGSSGQRPSIEESGDNYDPVSQRYTLSGDPMESGAAPAQSGFNASLSWMDDEEEPASGEPPTTIEPVTSELQEDVARAAQVQRNMLREAPQVAGYRFASRFESCSEVSGDFYEYISLPDNRIGFAQGDVSGHGIQAGLVMSMAKKVLAIHAKRGDDPVQVLSEVNDDLAEDLGGKMFVTITYGILDPTAGVVTWARAGHNPTLVYRAATGKIEEISPRGMVVGMKGGPLFAKATVNERTDLHPGDRMLIYTDGLTETMNRQDEEYGTERLNELLIQHGTLDLEQLLDRILDSVRGFRGGGEPQDDLTLLALGVD